ncbi:AAA family ATPase [Wolbachia endosymbiont (group A) of Sphecodes monilicornis]|uniref:AAA family ATPase n=1 Tax=Wolbachia endosymbiont (group A) of Sphecodes monilicornis TaxID=2954060 RepID=UPI0022260706|nr:AAA family ATPase [Wolbachia endosymbiont (group A) of Sphecodes monilicornis]
MVNINTKKQPAGFFIYLSGLSGSGKLSTAIELSNMIDALIVNSKFYNNVQACSIYDGVFERDPIPKEVQDRIYGIMQIMLQVIENYPIHSKNYIFIDKLMENNDQNMRMYDSIVRLSKKMGTEILPVVLRCDLLTLQKRIALKRQRKNRRVINVNNVIEKLRTNDSFIPPSAIEIENSNMSIKEVAQEIVNQMHKLSQIACMQKNNL